MIKAVLLDIDDTVLSFTGYVKATMEEGFETLCKVHYEPQMYDVFKKINTGLWHQLEQGELTFQELRAVRWNRIFEALGIDYDGVAFETFFRAKLNESAILEPGVVELLEHLKGKYVLGVASNGPFDQQISRLRAGNLLGYFDHFFISGKIGAQKPSSEFFDFCMNELRQHLPGLQPQEVMMIGDSLTADMAGGRQAGMKTCYYSAKPIPEGAMQPDFAVTQLSEITQLL